jgi:Ricin-type beta-trefoil lectin domain-like
MFSCQLMRRSRCIVKSLSTLFAASVLMFGAHAVHAQPIADGTYTITNACNGKVLGLENGSPNPGGNVILRDAGSVGAINWQVSATADGSTILRAANTQSALQTSYEQTQNETNVDLWTYWGSASQRWIIGDGGNGTFKLSFAAAPAMALNAKYGGTNGETEVWLYAANDTCAQRWNMRRADDVVRNDLNAGATFTVAQSGQGKTIYIAPNGNDNNSGLNKSQAMATLSGAQYLAAAGDTIEIAGGEYAWVDSTWLNVSGRADDWIVIRAEEVNGQPASVIIKGDYRKVPPHDVSCIGTGSTYLEIRNLTCENFSNVGFKAIGSHHLSLIGNTFRDMGSSGVGLYSDRGKGLQANEIRVENNTIANTNREWYQRYSEMIRNNIVVNGRIGFSYGSYGFDEGGGDGMRDSQIINNTFVGSLARVTLMNPGKRSTHSGNVIANNIFYWTGAVNDSPVLIHDTTGLSFSNNLRQGVAAGTAAGTGDVTSDPKFSNANGQSPDDFRIGLASPASGTGNVAYQPVTDFFGSNRNVKSSLDIGAILAR